MRVSESVRVDLAERLRIAVGGELVDRRHCVVADPFRSAGRRWTARVDAQDGADQRIETLYHVVFEKILNERVSTKPVVVAGK